MPKNNSQEITQNNTQTLTQNEPNIDQFCQQLQANEDEKLVPNENDPVVMVLEKYKTRYPIWQHSGQSTGAPTKCTQELVTDIVTLLMDGNYIETACQAIGIPKQRYYEWLKFADRDENDGKYPGFGTSPDLSPYLVFRDSVKIARAQSEAKLLRKGHELANANAKTWMMPFRVLEASYPDRWAQKQQVTIDHTIHATIEAMPEPPKTLSEALDRARLQAETARDIQAIAVDAEYKVALVENGNIMNVPNHSDSEKHTE